MIAIPHYLTGLTAFIKGEGILGAVKQVTLPKVETIRETITQGGFERSLSTGVFKAMECEITITEFNKFVYNSWAESVPIDIKGSVKSDGINYPILISLEGTREMDDGNLETGKGLERKIKIYVDKYILEVNGKIQVKLDTKNMIAKINGKPYLEELRAHLQ